MADRTYRRSRYDRDRNRQAEQFDTSEQSWRDEERGYGQMGESWRDDDYESPYSRSRDFSRDRGYARTSSDYSRSEPSAYTSGRYGPNPYTSSQTPGFAPFTGSDQGGRDFTQPRFTGDRSYSSDYGGYGAGTQLARNRGEWTGGSDYGSRSTGYGDRNERGWFERAGDEVASWFGDDDAARRREQDYSGHGPSGYTRSDERILEDANDELTDDWAVDARNIQVTVTNGEVTLDGTVPSRDQKRRAEDCVEDISGVKNVQNNLRVQEAGSTSWNRSTTSTETTS